MKINIRIEGNDKEFTPPFVSARMLKETIKMGKIADANNPDEDMIDTMANYIVKLFGNQFTVDQLYDGIASDKLIPFFLECVKEVLGNLNLKMNELQNVSPNV